MQSLHHVVITRCCHYTVLSLYQLSHGVVIELDRHYSCCTVIMAICSDYISFIPVIFLCSQYTVITPFNYVLNYNDYIANSMV